MIVLIVLIVLVVLALLFLLSLRGRTGHPGLKALHGWAYAHRGLHDEVRPENSMAAFRAALEAGYGIELDLHLLKDGNLAVMHDSDLIRTTGKPGRIEDLTTENLKNYPLGGTTETIPTFREVLTLFGGKAPMIIELKTAHSNGSALCEAVCRMLDDYRGPYCLESFDPRCLLWLRRHRPDIIRGQLSENFIAHPAKAPLITQWLITTSAANLLTRPDFLAYKFEDRCRLSLHICRRWWHLQGVSWTIRRKEDYDQAVREGWLPIFENFNP